MNTSAQELVIVRAAFAKHVMAAANVNNVRVEAAFAAVPREHFLGRGPWQIVRGLSHYIETPSADPVYLYTNDLVGIIPERQLNNGQPSYHAGLLARLTPRAKDRVVHIGVGLGYYTAILAHLVGSQGSVIGIEFDLNLAERARSNLRDLSNVEIRCGDGTTMPFEPSDYIYVNVGATKPADVWLDGLNDRGRLILPLTTNQVFSETFDKITCGGVFVIQRVGDEYLAQYVSSVAVFPNAGHRDEELERALANGFKQGGEKRVTRLYRKEDVPPDRIWAGTSEWCLAYT